MAMANRYPLVILAVLVLLLAAVQGLSGRVLHPSGGSYWNVNGVDDHEEASSRRRELQSNTDEETGECVETGNTIDDCWRLDANWTENRQKLADCAIGFGHNAEGGKRGEIYVVTDPSDDPEFPANGTLRYGVAQLEPLWIIFERDMNISLKQDLIFANNYKTIDGRGAKVAITGGAGLLLDGVSHIIIHGISVHDIVYSRNDGNQLVTVAPNVTRGRGSSGEDGVRIINVATNIWVDHCYLSSCYDGLLDVTRASTNVTISNNHFENHDKVMLLGHSDSFIDDVSMRVTVTMNRFGENLTQRMPRCRFGHFHVVNNDYRTWGQYAVGGSSNPTIYSEGNRFTAGDAKQVTKRMEDDEEVWATWNWASEGDMFENDAFFTESGSQDPSVYEEAISMTGKPATMVAALTADAGPLHCQPGLACCSQTSSTNTTIHDGN